MRRFLYRYFLRCGLSLLACMLSASVHAQLHEVLTTEDYHIDTTQTNVLSARVNTLGFFRDNEYASSLTVGYTLPGAAIGAALQYNPLHQLHLELGAHALLFNGANKYPCYAYHDIVAWKGNQYQRGAHVVPWFRAQAHLRNVNVVLGNLYGGMNHQLIEPMYNPEQDLSTDPEMGFQILVDRRRVHLDTWMNWQSYIFEMDSHQEAFTVGHSARVYLNDPTSRIHYYMPAQLLIQHRGGEQDTTQMGVQTLCNASIGLGVQGHPHTRRGTLSRWDAQASAVASYQQNGHIWPFDTGFAVHAMGGVTLWSQLSLQAGYVGAPRRFIPLFGSPLYGTLSLSHGTQYRGMHTGYLRADYTHQFTPSYILGAEAELQQSHTRQLHETNFSFGVYLRICPQFRIHRF